MKAGQILASAQQYRSQFGGMWIDRFDFPDRLAEMVRDGRVSAELAPAIQQFERDGYCVLRNAASSTALDEFEEAISRAFREGHEGLIGQLPGDDTPYPVIAGMPRRRARVVDCYVALPSALDLLATPPLMTFMRAIFEETPLLFQSLSFDMGSEQGLHQDTAYVVVAKRPLELLACWIALEDVRPGSGELQYMVGSHRLGDFDFGGVKKHWVPQTDGHEPHERWCQWIYDEGATRGLPIERFLGKRGDILIWHADLAHGGAPIENSELTRKSLVGHYCPISADPHFFEYAPHRAVRRHYGDMAYASGHFDLECRSRH